MNVRSILARIGLATDPQEAAHDRESREMQAETIYRLAHVIRRQSEREQERLRRRRDQ